MISRIYGSPQYENTPSISFQSSRRPVEPRKRFASLQLRELWSHTSDVAVKTVKSYFVLQGVSKSLELWNNSHSAYKDLIKRGELTWAGQKARYSGKQRLEAVQDLDVQSVKGLFLFCTLLKVLRQGITSFVSLALTIVNLKVVTRKFLGLADLSGAQTLYVHKPVEVVVVGEYKHLMPGHF